jgi:transcriptional regulator with XRE-family HTH domain
MINDRDSEEEATPLAKALKESGMSISELARRLKTNRQNVSRWAKGDVGVRPKVARQIAEILTVSAESLVMREPAHELDVPKRPQYVHVRGTIAAGVWLEHDDAPQMTDDVPIIGGRWSALEQWAYRVSGPSVDLLRIFDGDYVVCVPYFDARRWPTQDDVVVVERKRGQTIERTVKQLVVTPSGCELWPRSSDPRYQAPLLVDKQGEGTEEDGTTVEIVGLVIYRGAAV